MGVKALLLDERDTVATCIGTVAKQVVCTQPIPLCHKIALKDMQEDEDVYKYGQVIGRTTQVIKKVLWCGTRIWWVLHAITRLYYSNKEQ